MSAGTYTWQFQSQYALFKVHILNHVYEHVHVTETQHYFTTQRVVPGHAGIKHTLTFCGLFDGEATVLKSAINFASWKTHGKLIYSDRYE